MPGNKFLANADVAAWLGELSKTMRVFAPRGKVRLLSIESSMP